MKKITVADITLREGVNTPESSISFKEKIEVAKNLDKLNVDIIEFAKITDEKADSLMLRSLAPVIKNSVMACPAGLTKEEIEKTWAAVSGASKPRLVISVPVSSVQMEYIAHVKANKIVDFVTDLVSYASSLCADVEFSAEDATRSESETLYAVIDAAIKAGAKTVNISDTAGTMLPDEFGAMVKEIYENVPSLKDVTLSVTCSDALDMANSCIFASIKAGATQIKASVTNGSIPSIESLLTAIKAKGDSLGICTDVNMLAINNSIKQIKHLIHTKKKDTTPFDNELGKSTIDKVFDAKTDISAVCKATKKLGYDLSEDDKAKVYEAFCRVINKKGTVSSKELDAIVASVALQVPPAYRLISYVINSGNVITSTANITLEKDGNKLQGISIGDGPIDAAFLAIEQIIGHHFELDDFQIQAVTEGREAMGEALVKLRANGKLYSGKGISTDIIGASIRGYVNALNKIIFEENN